MLLFLCSLLLTSALAVTPAQVFNGSITDDVVTSYPITFNSTDKMKMMRVKVRCNTERADQAFIIVEISNEASRQDTIHFNVLCDDQQRQTFSAPQVFGDSTFQLQLAGAIGVNYTVIVLDEDVGLSKKTDSATVTLFPANILVRTFQLTEEDIRSKDDELSYVQVQVDSPDKKLSNGERNVAKLMVTQQPETLKGFYFTPNATTSNAMRLSFSTFGMITLSNASVPALNTGTWFIAVVLTSPRKSSHMRVKTKNVTISYNVVNDYKFSSRIWILLAISMLGVILPIGSRFIFDYAHFFDSEITLESYRKQYWSVLVNWIWTGSKGLTYLTTLLACLLIVSAFQVVNAKWRDMSESGDRDICYYNEKCYRPYGGYYDVSVNGIASNLPFMVHGVILVLYFSMCEAYCRAKGHKYFDYSIPYSFGIAFICEGFGSLLYHICPSQIIFQFDTLFMFVITVIMIIGIFEGYSIRRKDIKVSSIAKHKAIRAPKVFSFFVGPVYFFNFIGNLIATEGLPSQIEVLFYMVFGVWWVCILLWAAYKIDIMPDSWDPTHVDQCIEKDGIEGTEVPTFNKIIPDDIRRIMKLVLFALYCVLVGIGFAGAVMKKVPFSIFILGVLVVAVVILTTIYITPLMLTLYKHMNSDHKYRDFLYRIPFVLITYFIGSFLLVVTALTFFKYFHTTDKSLPPWKSRELNSACFLNNFYDTHDFWHLSASFSVMAMALVNVQISKPCRDCFVFYVLKKEKERKERRESMRELESAIEGLEKDGSECSIIHEE